jgi:hypothetical protein
MRNNVNNQVVEDNRSESDTCSNNEEEEEEEDDDDDEDDFFMNSVIKIQSGFRGHIGRSLVNVRKDRDVEKLQVLKAIKIQSIMRRKIIVKKRKDEKDKVRKEERIEKDRIKREEAIEKLRLERNQKIALKFDGQSPPKDNLKILKKHSAIHNQYKTNQTETNELHNSPNQTKSSYHKTSSATNQTQSQLTKCLIDQRNHIKPNQRDMALSWFVDDFEDIMIAKEAVRNIISRADLYS